MYQYSTFHPLAMSKGYFDSVKECSDQLRKAIRCTNLWRGKREIDHLKKEEIVSGQRLLRLDHKQNDRIFDILGEPQELTTANLEEKHLVRED